MIIDRFILLDILGLVRATSRILGSEVFDCS
jgi:hypothetical protein